MHLENSVVSLTSPLFTHDTDSLPLSLSLSSTLTRSHHLDQIQFLERLAELFEARKNKGSVFLTTKRCTPLSSSLSLPPPSEKTLIINSHPSSNSVTYDSEPTLDQDATIADSTEVATPSASTSNATASNEKEFPLIVRATDGKGKKDIKVKLSTIVSPQSPMKQTGSVR